METAKLEPNQALNTMINLAEDIIKDANYLLGEIDAVASQKQLEKIIKDTLSLLEELNSNQSKDNRNYLIEELQKAALCLPNNWQKRKDFSSVCYSVAKACVFLMALSLAFTVGYVFFAWYFSFLTTTYFLDYLVYSVSSIGIPSLSMGLFSTALGKFFTKDAHKVEDLQSKIAELGELASQYQAIASPNPTTAANDSEQKYERTSPN